MISPSDVIVSSYPEPSKKGRITGMISQGVKVTQKETGIAVVCTKYRQQYRNRQIATNDLQALLNATQE